MEEKKEHPVNVYRSDMNIEQKPAKCLIRGNTHEVISNDGQMKIILVHRTTFNGSEERQSYVADYHIREGDGWIITNTKASFDNIDDFWSALAAVEEFSQASEEYEQFNINH